MISKKRHKKITEAAEPWNGVWNATYHRAKCIAFSVTIPPDPLPGDDDCLYLNVYTPDVNENAEKPVILLIHAGYFHANSGDDDLFGPDYILEQDLILVTFNYRHSVTGTQFYI